MPFGDVAAVRRTFFLIMYRNFVQVSFNGGCEWRGERRLWSRRFKVAAVRSQGHQLTVSTLKGRSKYRLSCQTEEKGDRIDLYDAALNCARRCQYNTAQSLFEELLATDPHLCKAWVSYAQACHHHHCAD